MLADRGRQPHRQLDREYRGRLGNPDPARCHRLVRVPAGLPLRATEPAGQLTGGLGHRDTSLHQLSGRVDAQRVLTAASTSTSHVINVLPGMSLPGRAAPGPFQPPVAESDVEAEVIYCVGGVISPVLSNVYLDKLDAFVEQELIPQYTRGASRRPNPVYREKENELARARRRGDRAAYRDLRRQKYIRYADDHILGFIGPKAEAEEIKARLAGFLRETLGLELNDTKTLITHARTQRARFLGYHVIVQHCDTKLTKGQRSANGRVALRVPPDVVKAQCTRYRQRGKPWHRPRLQNLPDYDIMRTYGAEYAGVANYYLLAQDVWRIDGLRWYAQTSMLKTLAAKHKSTVTAMAARHKAKIETSDGLRTCFEARKHREGKPDLVARFGGINLRQDRRAVIRDPAPAPAPVPRKEQIGDDLGGAR